MTDDEKEEAADKRREELIQIVKDACTRLSEHFDNVQIFASKNPTEMGDSAGETESFRWGVGNWFARTGQIRDFVDETVSETRNKDKFP